MAKGRIFFPVLWSKSRV